MVGCWGHAVGGGGSVDSGDVIWWDVGVEVVVERLLVVVVWGGVLGCAVVC